MGQAVPAGLSAAPAGMERETKLAEHLPLSGKKVVLIDDSNTIRRSGEIFLSQAGCEVVLSGDGFDGLGKIAAHRPDLIFIDVIMPRLDGYQTCALIWSHPAFRDIPIVMLTSKDALFDRARAKLAGARQYLLKPFTQNSLVEAVLAHAGPAR
jgi:twitching motility two-component system response regulator PilG